MEDRDGDDRWEEAYRCNPGENCQVINNGDDFECVDDPFVD